MVRILCPLPSSLVAPLGTFLPVRAPGALHSGLGMETLGGNAFVRDFVQVGDASLTLFVGWVNLDPDHLWHLRLDQVDQIQ